MSTSTVENVVIDDSKRAQVVQETIQKASRIATLPAVAVRVIHLCEAPETAIDTLSKAIDPVLGMKILKLVNSAYYGMPRQVSTIRHAILMLGLNSVKNIAIAASLVKMLKGGKVSPHFNANDLWTHSMAVAIGARMLAQKSSRSLQDEAFLAGMIHDIGIIVEMQVNATKFSEMLTQLSSDPSLPFCSAEEAIMGASHEHLGAALCEAWRFPQSLQDAAGYHHRPWEIEQEYRQLPAFVHIADVLASRLELGYTRTVETTEVDPDLCATVNLSLEDVEAVAVALPDAMQESKKLLDDK